MCACVCVKERVWRAGKAGGGVKVCISVCACMGEEGSPTILFGRGGGGCNKMTNNIDIIRGGGQIHINCINFIVYKKYNRTIKSLFL